MKYLTADEVAEMLRISKPRLYRMAREGEIPHCRLPRGTRGIVIFDREEVEAWIEAQKVGGQG